MERNHTARGFTLIEVMLAMALLAIGVAGVMGLLRTGYLINADARRMTRAVTIAQDLMNQVELWPYGDPRLAIGDKAEDDITDDTGAYESEMEPVADHAEEDLAAGYQGIPAAALDGIFQRYWNVAYDVDENENGIPDGVRVAVIVRWPHGSGWRRVVLTGFKPNPVN